MTCFRPRTGFRGKGGMVFHASNAVSAKRIAIDCGSCSGCIKEYSRQLAIRSVHEAAENLRNCFITLTYRPECLPPNGSLEKPDWVKFAKRLRHVVPKFRFLMCGEYGEKKNRPHYHALLFGIDFHEDRKKRHNSVGGFPMWTSELLDKTWGKGDENPIGAVSFETAAYIASYAMKKVRGERAEKHYGGRIDVINEETGEVTERLVRTPEFALMSRNPGLGNGWFQKYWKDVYANDELECNGKVMRPPKYYDVLYERMEPEKMEKVKVKRLEEISKRPEEYTKDRLRYKEEMSKARMSRYKKAQI